MSVIVLVPCLFVVVLALVIALVISDREYSPPPKNIESQLNLFYIIKLRPDIIIIFVGTIQYLY